MGKIKAMLTAAEEAAMETVDNFDELSLEEIRHLINIGRITENDVIYYYCNVAWEDVHE